VGEGIAKPGHPSFSQIGPAWIAAIAALISAVVATAAFFAGRVTASGGDLSQPQTLSTPGTKSQIDGLRQQSTPSPSQTPPGTTLANTSVTIPDGYGITFSAGPMKPHHDAGDLQYGTGFDVGQLEWPTGQVAALRNGNPTYSACSTDTLYIASSITDYSPGTILCFTGHGVVAAITITATDSASGAVPSDVKANVMVWKAG
jgi:hypothetical protein